MPVTGLSPLLVLWVADLDCNDSAFVKWQVYFEMCCNLPNRGTRTILPYSYYLLSKVYHASLPTFCSRNPFRQSSVLGIGHFGPSTVTCSRSPAPCTWKHQTWMSEYTLLGGLLVGTATLLRVTSWLHHIKLMLRFIIRLIPDYSPFLQRDLQKVLKWTG